MHEPNRIGRERIDNGQGNNQPGLGYKSARIRVRIDMDKILID